MGYSAHDVLPKNFTDYFIAHLSEKIAEKTEQNIWSGVEGNGTFDGFATLLASDSDLPTAQKIAGETVTAENVVDALGSVVDAIPSSLYGNEDLFYTTIINSNEFLGGFQAGGQGANGFMAQGNNQDIDIQHFDGVKVVCANGLANDTMISTLKSNLYFGTGLLNDQNEVKILDMSDLDGSKNVRFIMRYTASVQYSISSDIVTYGI